MSRTMRCVTAGLLLSVNVTARQAPDVIVERHWHSGDRAVRVTLFDNRVAVTTVREGNRQVFMRKLTLSEIEFSVYREAIAEVAAEAGLEDRVPIETLDSGASVTLRFSDGTFRTFTYTPLQVLDLPTGRLVAILDDIQQRVADSTPSEEALKSWIPVEGDVVELYVGGTATVTEVREDGIIVLEQDDTEIILVVPPNERHLIILRVIE